MLVPLNWLKEYVDFPWSPSELADRLTMAGFEVEEVTYLGEGLQNVVVGKVLSVEAHPQADKLTICQVDAGERGTYTVVCGAPNVAANILTPLALPGSKLPSGMEIKKAKLRGVESSGMLCSADELGLPGGHDGLMILDQGTPGEELATVLGLDSWVLDVSVLANRPDCLSMLGIAREVAALTGSELKLPQPKLQEAGEPIAGRATVEVLAEDLCPRYLARLFTDVKIGSSPQWLKERLLAAGMRPINNVVDITNYVMLEYGQPLHAFDYEKLAGCGVIVRRANNGETMVTLDDQERKLTDEMLVIADKQAPACIAGIMGGDWVEVGENTSQIFLEAASFARGSVRRTSRSLGLASESSLRFERGVDPYLPAEAIERAAQLLEELTGAKTAKGRIDKLSPRVATEKRTIEISQQYINDTLGANVPKEEIERIFQSLDLAVDYQEGSWLVTIPHRRIDLERKPDLLEEIARLWGFEKIPATLPSGSGSQGAPHRQQAWEEAASQILIDLGLSEALSYGFFAPSFLEKTNLSGTPLGAAIQITNPLSEDQSLMRTTLIPSLLHAAAHNRAHQLEDIALFELGKVFQKEETPTEKRALGIVLAGRLIPTSWRWQESPADFYTLKGIVENCLSALQISGWQVARPKELAQEAELMGLARALHPGRSAAILVDTKVVGIFGELAPQVAENWELTRGTLVAELDLEALWSLRSQKGTRYQPLSRFPFSSRDLALLVPETIPAQKVSELIAQEGGKLLEGIELFDLYSGSQVPAGMRSLAYRLKLGSRERTIQEQEITQLEAKILEKLTKLGISLR